MAIGLTKDTASDVCSGGGGATFTSSASVSGGDVRGKVNRLFSGGAWGWLGVALRVALGAWRWLWRWLWGGSFFFPFWEIRSSS